MGQDPNRCLSKEDTQTANAYETMAHVIHYQGNARSNSSDTPLHTYQNGLRRSIDLTGAGTMWENRDPQSSLVGTQNGAVTVEDGWAVSYETKPTLTTRSSHHAPRCLPEGTEVLCPHKHLRTDVHSSSLYRRHTSETPRSPSACR